MAEGCTASATYAIVAFRDQKGTLECSDSEVVLGVAWGQLMFSSGAIAGEGVGLSAAGLAAVAGVDGARVAYRCVAWAGIGGRSVEAVARIGHRAVFWAAAVQAGVTAVA